MTEREREILEILDGWSGWARVMDCGGTDGSHHGNTLRKMLAKGWVERNPSIGSIVGTRSVNHYKITEAGARALAAQQNVRLGNE